MPMREQLPGWRRRADPASRARPAEAGRGIGSLPVLGVPGLLALQRAAGNRAVVAAVQRAGDVAAGDSVDVHQGSPLTIPPVQVTSLTPAFRARVHAFYRSQPDRYTADFITKMQQALKLPSPSGRIDDDTIDAIVLFQDQHPPLKGDGMAGPRTLSRLMPFGLATATDEGSYANLVEDAVDAFKPGSSVEERVKQAWAAVIPALTEEQVTPIPDVAKDDEGTVEGHFRPSTWTVFISVKLVDPLPVPNDKRAILRETVYHEARHAEQIYNVARMLASKKDRSAAEIAALTGTQGKPEVAQEAKSRPFQRGTPEFVVAQEMFEATHGAAGKRHDDIEKKVVAKKKALDAALDAANNDRTDPRVVKAQREFDAVNAQYADLADEADAFATGNEAARVPRTLEL